LFLEYKHVFDFKYDEVVKAEVDFELVDDVVKVHSKVESVLINDV
jgi:hypothetical protein